MGALNNRIKQLRTEHEWKLRKIEKILKLNKKQTKKKEEKKINKESQKLSDATTNLFLPHTYKEIVKEHSFNRAQFYEYKR